MNIFESMLLYNVMFAVTVLAILGTALVDTLAIQFILGLFGLHIQPELVFIVIVCALFVLLSICFAGRSMGWDE